MKLSLPENIRRFRKERRMTQEKLAEALGVTVGAVYKWESGQSQPELNLVVELADFFDTSVDVLLGYRMQDNRLDSALDRLNTYCRTLDPEAITEAEKILGRYPHSFKAVYYCSVIFLVYGAAGRDPHLLRRALELLERARVLLPQNEDPRISVVTISGDMATVLFLLDEKEKSLELLKQNNAGGIFSGEIGSLLAVSDNDPAEAETFLSEALTAGMSNLLTAILGYVFVYRSRKEWRSAVDILNLGLDILTGLKRGDTPDVLAKTHAEMLVMLAYVQKEAGMPAESRDALKKARDLSRRFDSRPDYSLTNMRFADHTEQSVAFDILGASASDSIAELIRLLGDAELAKAWEEPGHD